MKYGWKALPLPGMAALVDEIGNHVALVQRKSDFFLGYLGQEQGPVRFDKIVGRFMLLGAYPSLKSAGKAIEFQQHMFSKLGKYPGLVEHSVGSG